MNVSGCILGSHILGSLLITGNLICDVYLNMFKDEIDSFITQIREHDQNHNVDRLHFQQDRAPTHYVAPVSKFMDNRFSGR